jgi:hypothetical protein
MMVLKGFLIALGALALLSLLAGGVAYSLINRPTAIEEQITLASSRPSESDEEFEVFNKEVEGNFLVLTEDDGSKLIDFATKVKGIPIKGRIVKVEFVPDRILATVDAEVYGLKTKLAVATKVEVEDAKPKITVEEVNIGKLPLPAAITDKINALLSQELEKLMSDMPVEIEDIRITEGQFIVQVASP